MLKPMSELVPRCNCGKPAVFVTTWQTPFMRAPSFWYDCAACLQRTEDVLKAHPQIIVTTRKVEAA